MQRSTSSAYRPWFVLIALAALALTTLACGFQGGAFGSTPTPVKSAAAGQAPGITPTLAVFVPNVSASGQAAGGAPAQGGEPIEALLITAPQPGQGVRGSIHVEGYSDPDLKQISIMIRDVKGTMIGTATPSVQAQPDGRAKFSADILLAANFPTQTGRVIVYATDAKGVVSHLDSTEVQLNGSGQAAAAPVDEKTLEAIAIVLPNPGAPLKGTAKVSAVTMLVPDIVVEVRDANNQVVGRVQQKLTQTELPAQVLAEVPLQVTQAGPGYVLVYALNPRDGQTEHLSSIAVQLTP